MGQICMNGRCVAPAKARQWVQGGVFKIVNYFKANAGSDGKLSWQEIQKAPFVLKRGFGTKLVYKPSLHEFKRAQSSKHDSDPGKLNFVEFMRLVKKAGFTLLGYFSKNPIASPSCPHCAKARVSSRVVRRAIRRRMADVLSISWPAKRKEI